MANHGATSLLEVATAFRPRILAEHDHIEAGRRLPEDLTPALARAGFFRIFLPAAYGENGAPRRTQSGAPESRFFLCPATNCEIVDTWTTGGLRGTGRHDVVVRDLFVPAPYASLYTDPMVLAGARYRIPFTSRVTSGLGAMALGVARGAIEALVDLAADKRHERTSQPLREDRGAQTRLSQAEALVGTAFPVRQHEPALGRRDRRT